MTKEIELNEMLYKHKNGTQRKCVIVKKQEKIRRKAEEKELFEDLSAYHNSCFVTNEKLTLDQICDINNRRVDSENRIKELKQDFGREHFSPSASAQQRHHLDS